MYYDKIIDYNKNNPIEIWNILNTLIKDGTQDKLHPNYLINVEVYDITYLVNNFNSYHTRYP